MRLKLEEWNLTWLFYANCFFWMLQENSKTKHPQLLYEAKLYNVLQGGSMHFALFSFCFYLWFYGGRGVSVSHEVEILDFLLQVAFQA